MTVLVQEPVETLPSEPGYGLIYGGLTDGAANIWYLIPRCRGLRPKPSSDFEPQLLGHHLGLGIKRLDRRQHELAGVSKRVQRAPAHHRGADDVMQALGCTTMALDLEPLCKAGRAFRRLIGHGL